MVREFEFLRYVGEEDKIYEVYVDQIASHIIRLTGDIEFKDSGFELVIKKTERINGNEETVYAVYGEYHDYKTLYRKIEGGIELSDDESVYTPPVERPENEEPPRYEPTLEVLKEWKVSEMNSVQQATIARGVDVELSDGTTKTFSLTANDQISLLTLSVRAAQGEEFLPWHEADENEPCLFYSNADMVKITETAMAFVTHNVTYFRDLRRYIRSLDSKEDVESVFYGMLVPEEFQSEPLKYDLAILAGQQGADSEDPENEEEIQEQEPSDTNEDLDEGIQDEETSTEDEIPEE